MFKNTSRVLAALLAMLMLFVFAGCKDNETSGTSVPGEEDPNIGIETSAPEPEKIPNEISFGEKMLEGEFPDTVGFKSSHDDRHFAALSMLGRGEAAYELITRPEYKADLEKNIYGLTSSIELGGFMQNSTYNGSTIALQDLSIVFYFKPMGAGDSNIIACQRFTEIKTDTNTNANIKFIGKVEDGDFLAMTGFLCVKSGVTTFETTAESFAISGNIPAAVSGLTIDMPAGDDVRVSVDNLVVVCARFPGGANDRSTIEIIAAAPVK